MNSRAIRVAEKVDATQLARLFTSLGHETMAASITAAWDEWTAAGNRALVAACPDQELVGVATLHQMTVLHRPLRVGRITVLFVQQTSRGQGIGRLLVDAAEAVFAGNGCGLLEVTSNFRLTDAHEFYEHLGYTQTSVRLAKPLTQIPSGSSSAGLLPHKSVNRSRESGGT